MTMLRIKTDHGIREVQGLDINVWLDEESGTVNLTAYEAYTGEDGYRHTNTSVVLFSTETDLSPDSHADEWYDWESSAPGTIPGEVARLVRRILPALTRDAVTR
jgi:hypothetical protein